MEKYTKQEQEILDAIMDGRKVQDFLFGDLSLQHKSFNRMDWVKVFQKRVDKITEIDMKHPSAMIELRKRVLQNACLSVMLLQKIQNNNNI